MTVFTGLQFFGGGELDTYEWDTLYLGGELWPGICEVTGSGVSRRVDAKATQGSDGAVLKDQGMNLAKLTIKLMIYNQTDWIDLQRLLPTIHPRRPGGSRTPTSISTPYTKLLGIDDIYITSINIPALDKTVQQMTITMQAIEWVPQPKPVKKGAGSGTSGTSGFNLEEFADLTSEAAQALWEDSPADEAIDGVTGLGENAVNGFLDSIGLGDDD
jgi:hypothetical protein